MTSSTLPGAAVPLPAIGFGGAPLGNLFHKVASETAHATVDAAWNSGIRYFDTAPHYGLGLSERRLGAALSSRPRDQYVLSTKVGRLLRPNPAPKGGDPEGFDVPDDLIRMRDYSRDGVLRSIEESLCRLQTDRIDLVYVHDPDDHWDQVIAGAAPTLAMLRDQGVIGAWGVGMNQPGMLLRFVRETDVDAVMMAGHYTLLQQDAAEELLPACHERQVAVVNAGIYNSGLLATNRPSADATFNYHPASAELKARANLLADVCEAHGTTLPAAAMQFAVDHPAIAAVVVGMRTPAEVARNVALMQSSVPEAVWDDLRRLDLIRTPKKEEETPQ